MRYLRLFIIKTLMRGLVKRVLLEDDFKKQEYTDQAYYTGCKNLSKNRLLRFILQKHRRGVIMKLTNTNVTNLTKEEDAFYRGALYMLRVFERTIHNGKENFEKFEEFEKYFD